MILVAHSYYLTNDPKQLARMKPYSPLATLLTAATLRREGHGVALFDAMLASGVKEFEAALDATAPAARYGAGRSAASDPFTTTRAPRSRDRRIMPSVASRERKVHIFVR